MADGFIGEIRAFGFNFTPVDWLPCDGSTLSVQTNSALFAIIGTYFGGNGTTNFKLPDLRGVVLTGIDLQAAGFNVPGASGGTDNVTITTATMPAHNHNVMAVTRSNVAQTSLATAQPSSNTYLSNAFCSGLTQGIIAYSNVIPSPSTLNVQTLAISGGSQPHSNMAPYLTMNYCICVAGIFPPHP
jgi:microcystin-dependent protein